MKNSFIKNYEAIEGKECVGYVYTLAEKVIYVAKQIAKEDTCVRLTNNSCS